MKKTDFIYIAVIAILLFFASDKWLNPKKDYPIESINYDSLKLVNKLLLIEMDSLQHAFDGLELKIDSLDSVKQKNRITYVEREKDIMSADVDSLYQLLLQRADERIKR